MQYRNDTPGPLTLAVEPPVVVEPGEVIDSDDHVAGLTPLDDPAGPEFAAAAALEGAEPPAGAAAGGVDVDQADADDAGVPATTDPDGAPAPADDEQEPEATR